MADKRINLIEEALRNEVQKLDKRVRLVAVEPDRKKNFYRVILEKDGRSGSADLEKEITKQFLSDKSKGKKLRKALGKAVSHLSIKYGR